MGYAYISISKNKDVICFQIHFLPETMLKNIEYIFKINSNLSEEEQLNLWSKIYYELCLYHDELGFEFDFITMIKF